MESVAEVRKNSNTRIRHGFSKTPLYQVWGTMKDRCYNQNLKAYKHYGARGIRVDAEWESSFLAFREWAIANGYEEGLEIDRKDTNGHYTPSNCRWIDHTHNCRNKRTNVLVTAWGETKPISEWSEDPRCKVDKGSLRHRIANGNCSTEEAITRIPLKTKPPVRLSPEQTKEVELRVVLGTMGGDRRSTNGKNNRGNVKDLAEEFGVSTDVIVRIGKQKRV